MSFSYNQIAGQSVERLAALSDGILGVAMEEYGGFESGGNSVQCLLPCERVLHKLHALSPHAPADARRLSHHSIKRRDNHLHFDLSDE